MVAVQFDLDPTVGNTPTDTAGNTYTRRVSIADATLGSKLEIWTAQNNHTTSSNVVTCTDNGGGVNSIVCVEEWTGAATSGAFDKSAVGSGTGTAMTTASSGVLSQADELVWIGGMAEKNADQLVLGSGYTNLIQNHTGSVVNLGSSSKVVAATTAVTGAMTTGSANWSLGLVTMKGAASAFIARPNPTARQAVNRAGTY
jgi:hypothetical protein